MTPADWRIRAAAALRVLVALAIEGMATVTDEIIDLHDRIFGQAVQCRQRTSISSGSGIRQRRSMPRCGCSGASAQELIGPSKQAAIVRRHRGRHVWDAFAESVTEAQRLAQPEDFDFLHRIGELRHAAPLRAGISRRCSSCEPRPPPGLLDAIEVLHGMDSDNARKGARRNAPTEFIKPKPRWQKLVMTDTGIDRRYYELCALSN